VLELGSYIAGPLAGQFLGDYGAEVIKVEPPGGDVMRQWGVCKNGRSLWWPAIARNKKSIVVDLRKLEGQRVIRRLAEACDVVLENFRPGTLRGWGLDYKRLSETNRRLVMVHVSGFGQTGPRAKDPGFGSIGEAIGGIRYSTGYPDRPSTRTGISLGDAMASLFAVTGTLAALAERGRSGLGQEVDVAIYEAVFALMESSVADYELAGTIRQRTGSILPGVAPSNAYPTADGQQLVIAANGDSAFVRLCQAMEQPQLHDDARFVTHAARGRHSQALDELISEWTADLDLPSLAKRLDAFAVPYGQINSAADIAADPLFAARGSLIRVDAGFEQLVAMAGVVPTFSRTPGRVRWPGPELGQHSDDTLVTLGQFTPAEVFELKAKGVVA
jgi:formyl-CoA transferase/succinyl-CoA--D-citramalate CoA-transferase